MTAGEHLVALSGLGAVTAGQHLLAIIAGGGVSQTIYASQFTVRIDTPDITVATLAQTVVRTGDKSQIVTFKPTRHEINH